MIVLIEASPTRITFYKTTCEKCNSVFMCDISEFKDMDNNENTLCDVSANCPNCETKIPFTKFEPINISIDLIQNKNTFFYC
jgi:RNase P subunit RPR2